MKRTLIPDDYEIVEDMMAPPGGRVEVKDRIKISTSERVEVERGSGGRVLAVHIIPARGPAVGLTGSSSTVGRSTNTDLLYRGKNNRSGRRAPRRLPQI